MKLRIVAFGLLVATGAHANGRYAGAYQIVGKPGDPDVLVTRTTFGLLLSTDRGANWDWICEDAVGYGADGAQEDPTLAITGNGSVLVGLQAGLGVSTPDRCAWTFPIATPIIDVTVSQSMPSNAVAISGQQLHRSIDNGKTFNPWGVPIDAQYFPITVDVAPSDDQTVYVTARLGPGNVGLFVSTNGAGSWINRAIPVGMTEKDAYIGAIDPTKPDRVFVRTYDAFTGGGRLLVTSNAGQMWQELYASKDVPLNGFAISPDGLTHWLGGDFGVLKNEMMVSSVQPKCLGLFGPRLYACTDVKQEFLAVSDDQGTNFKQLLPFCGLRGPLACAAKCAPLWQDLRSGLGYPCPDAGAPSDASASGDGSAGEDSGTTLPPPKKTGCSCSSAPASSGVLGFFAALGLGFTLRNRKNLARARK